MISVDSFDQITWSDLIINYPDRASVEIPAGYLKSGFVNLLIGPSGVGKSSLVQILLGFQENYTGEVLITVSGQVFNLEQIDKTSWRDLISWMPQEPHFPIASVIQSVQMANPQLNQAEIIQQLNAVGLEISDLPHGVDTQLGTISEALSIGQKRKIALARALIKPAKLLILDEPTASVDEISQFKIDQLIKHQALCGQTVLIISHRSQAFLSADHLLSFEKQVRV